MATEIFTDEEFDQLEREVAAIFFPQPADEVEDEKDRRIAGILRRVDQRNPGEEDELA
jgi:hypothetical protein